MRRKIFSILLSVAMVMVMMPSMAFANTVTSKNLTVTDNATWTEAVAAIGEIEDDANKNLNISISNPGTYTTNFKIPGNKNITITGIEGVILDGQIAMLASDGRDGKTPSLILKNLTYKVGANIVNQTGISQTGASGIALWGDQSVTCNNVKFDMSLNDSTAITGWWDTGVGTSITVQNCIFDCNGQRPIRSCGNVTVDNCTFNDPYRYAVQLTAKADTAVLMDKAVMTFNNNIINNGASGKAFVYGVQLEGSDYGCHDLIVNGSGNVINAGNWDTKNESTMYYCECGIVDHDTIQWNTEVAPVHADSSFVPVAEIDGTQYATLQSAVNAAQDNDIVYLLKTTNGSGIEVKNPNKKNITIDFQGYTYTMDGTTVGSAGTESQSIHFEKGSNIVLQNGTLKIAKGAMGIQNYCNLTLKDFNVDSSEFPGCGYVMSNNNGDISIEGNSSIKAAEGRYAFDVCVTTHYPDGARVTVNTTGEIVGKILYDVWDGIPAENKTALNIQNGTFKGSFVVEDALKDAAKEKFSITGGTFSSDPSTYVAQGTNIYLKDSTYYVGAAPAHSSGMNTWTKGADGIYIESYVAPTTPVEKDPVSNEGTAGTDDATTNADLTDKVTTSEGKTEAVVDQDIADKIVDKAVENKSTEVVVEATTTAGTSDASQVALPESTVKAIAEKTDAALTIKTDNAEVTLDKEAVNAVADQAGTTGTVKLVVETVENTDDKVVVELKLETSNGYVSDFKGGNVSVTVPVAKDMADKKVVCVYIDDNGIYHKVDGAMNEAGTHYTFTTGHFSTYAIMSEEEADAVIKDQTTAAQKAAIKNVKTTVTLSTKNVKKGIRVTVKVPEDQKADKTGIIIYRSTSKNAKPYAVYKKVATKGSTYIIRNYYNVKGNRLVKGKTYYYKARAYKVIDGKTYYGPMSTIKAIKAK